MEFNDLIIEPTNKTPKISLNKLTGELVFSGRSIPENAAKIYEPAFEWVKRYILQVRPITNFRFSIEYYNTASSLWIAKILKVLVEINDPDSTLIIHLYLPLEEYDEIQEFSDIKEAFFPLSDIFHSAILTIGIKLYGTDDHGKIVKQILVYM